jgi:hypothetical protein
MRNSPEPLREAGTGSRRRTRWPGLAVLLVLLYGLLFLAGLVWLRARSPLFQGRKEAPARRAPRDRIPTAALLTGEGLPLAAREEYLRGLSSRCCPCGCELTVGGCLLSGEACVKSLEDAREMMEQLRAEGSR